VIHLAGENVVGLWTEARRKGAFCSFLLKIKRKREREREREREEKERERRNVCSVQSPL
jgi:hypothetical protein